TLKTLHKHHLWVCRASRSKMKESDAWLTRNKTRSAARRYVSISRYISFQNTPKPPYNERSHSSSRLGRPQRITRGRTGLLAVEASCSQNCFAILPNPGRFV